MRNNRIALRRRARYACMMMVPLLLLLASLAGVLVAIVMPGLADLILLAGPCALASALLLLHACIVSVWPAPAETPNYILLDGSNVMHWKDSTPRIETLREVVDHLAGLGFAPGVVFDANAGYLISGRYQHHAALGDLLGLPEDRVMVVNKGTPADTILLSAARDLGARIVSNDRFRDWAEQHPEVGKPGHVVRGGYREGKLWLDIDPATD